MKTLLLFAVLLGAGSCDQPKHQQQLGGQTCKVPSGDDWIVLCLAVLSLGLIVKTRLL